MTTSGVTSFELTARDLVQAALEDNGIIPLGEDMEAEELAACIVRLNLMLKSWSMRANLWREASSTVTITGGTGSLALAAGVQDVVNARHVVSATYSRPLAPWTRDEYRSLPNRASVGNPSAFYVERAISGLTLKVWPVPAANISVEIDYDRAAEVVTDAGQTVDFRAELLEVVQTNLALRCAGIFGAALSPELVARAQRLEREMFDADRPDSYFLEADCA